MARIARTRSARWALAGVLLCGAPWTAFAQPQLNPVYVDDSPAAADTLARVKDHLAVGNIDEAVRVLQALLDEHAERVTPSIGDPDVFVSVRARVNALLLADKPLLDRYRTVQGPRAAAIMDGAANSLRGPVDEVHRSLLLTPAGFEAALRTAQRQYEDARFEAARLTLEELESHPDRLSGGQGAADAADLLTAVARRLDRPEVWRRADEWAEQAGRARPPAHEPQPRSPAAGAPGLSPLGPLPPLDPRGLISKPLWTIELRPPNPVALDLPDETGTRGAAAIPPSARELDMIPSVSGDLMVINDGVLISAIDRFTLSPRWTIQPTPPAQPADNGADDRENAWGRRFWGSNYGPEPLTVTINGAYGAASTGRKSGDGRDGDDRILGIDPRSGRLRWAVSLGQLDPSLADSAVRGPLEVSEGVVVATVRKHAPDRRLMSLSMLGLDALTGRLLWLRPLASAGWLPFGPQSFGPRAMVISRGVAYRADELGAVAAVEVDSGYTLWMRRMPVEAGANTPETPHPWEVGRPVADGDSIVIIAPDRKRLVRLDTLTGAVLAARQASQFGSPGPNYLIRVGDQLAAIGGNRIAFAPLSAFDTAPVRLTPQIGDPGIWGRVSAVGDKLLTPLVKGLAIIDPGAPDADPLMQPLDKPGNVLAVGSQLLVVDDSQAHSYLQWTVAESLLHERMTADPSDPTSAVTFAELAYRAGKFDRILGAADAALTAIRADPASARNAAQRQRLFESLHNMVTKGLDSADAPSPPTPAPPAPAGPGTLPRLTDRALIGELVDRLRQAAVTPDDKVAVALASGRIDELAGDSTAAVAMYQGVLDDPALATADWRGPSVSVRAELEATRRLEQIIQRGGPAVYAAQEVRAQGALAALGPAPTVEQLRALASRFPLSVQTPDLFRRISDLEKQAGHDRESLAALESGIKAAQRIPNAPVAAVGELAGRLVVELRERRQPRAAAAVLRDVQRRLPGIALTAHEQPLDSQRIGAELAERIAATTRWPRVGPLTGEGVQMLSGWTLLEPMIVESTPHVAGCLVLQSDHEVGVFTVESSGEHAGDVRKLWGRVVKDLGAALIRSTPDAVYIVITSETVGGIEKVALTPGDKGWKTDPIAKLFPPGDETRGLQRVPGLLADSFDTPSDGVVPADDLIATMDERTLVLVQRGGRAVAIDCDSGETLWRASTGVSQVYDAQLVGGTLVVAGDVRKTNASGALEELIPAVQVADARTGSMGERIGKLGQGPNDRPTRVRWVKVTDSARLICGTEDAVLSIDLHSGRRDWTIVGPEVMPTTAAWLFGDRLLLMSADRQLYLASVSTGRLRPQALEAPHTRLESSRSVSAYSVGPNPDGGFAVSTYQGVMIFAQDGELRGIDGLGGIDNMLPPRPAEGHAITIETASEGRGPSGLLRFNTYALETGSAMLTGQRAVALGARPLSFQIIDSKIAITAGGDTVVVNAPVKP